jgi:hypothetical protein
MGTSYVKTAKRPEMKEIPLDPDSPWDYAEDLHQEFGDLVKRVAELEEESWYLQMSQTPATFTQPPSNKKHKSAAANSSTQTEELFAAEKMEIEPPQRRWIKCSSLKKKTYYTKVYSVKSTAKEEMEVEGEIKKKNRKSRKPKAIKGQSKVRWYKTYIKKEMMAIEESKETEAVSKSPPRKGNPGLKTKSQGTPPVPRKKLKLNTPKKVLGGSELKFNGVKLDSKPQKITLMTDFLSCIPKKNVSVPCIKKPPDPGKLARSEGQIYDVDKTDP